LPELPENDPVVSKSYALHYAVAMVLLVASFALLLLINILQWAARRRRAT